MLLLQALVAASKSWVDRAGGRWDAAALAMDSGKYDAPQLFRDVFRSAVTDPFQWYLDFSKQTDPGRVLIDARLNPSPSSAFIPVATPSKTVVTPLTRMGGTEVMAVGTDVFVDTTAANPAIPADMVTVRLKNVSGFTAGHYVGYLIDDTAPVAWVLVLR
jgi:hypothetical protein